MGMSAPSPSLQSWKAIASYLRVSVRTAQHWERERGLPVRRHPGEKSRVSADPAELDEWRDRHETASRPFAALLFWRAYSMGASLALLLLCGHEVFQYIRQRPGPPVRFHIESGSLISRDAAGRVVWTRAVPDSAPVTAYGGERNYPRRRLWSGDLNGDGETEIVYVGRIDRGSAWEIFCLGRGGEERWREHVLPPRKPEGEDREIVLTDLTAAPRQDHSAAVFVSLCQLPNHSGRVLAFDHDGKRTAEFPLPGHAEMLNLSGGTPGNPEMLLVGGFDTTEQEALLTTVDALRMSPGARCYFPRSCINRLLSITNRVQRIECAASVCEIGVEEWFDDRPIEIVYRLNGRLESLSAWFSDSFRAMHKRLELDGRLSHTIEQGDATMAQGVRIVRLTDAGAESTGDTRTNGATAPKPTL